MGDSPAPAKTQPSESQTSSTSLGDTSTDACLAFPDKQAKPNNNVSPVIETVHHCSSSFCHTTSQPTPGRRAAKGYTLTGSLGGRDSELHKASSTTTGSIDAANVTSQPGGDCESGVFLRPGVCRDLVGQHGEDHTVAQLQMHFQQLGARKTELLELLSAVQEYYCTTSPSRDETTDELHDL